jgi:hypothetical protein
MVEEKKIAIKDYEDSDEEIRKRKNEDGYHNEL